MTFTANIPSTGQSLGQTKNLISGNFTNYFNTVSQDHVAPNGAGGYAQGKHVKSTYVVQGSDPSTLANEMAVYSKLFNSIPTLFQRQQSSGAVVPLVSIVSSDSVTIAGTPQTQYNLIVGGMYLKWGFAFNCPDNTVVNYATAFPTATQSVFLEITDPNATSTRLNVKSSPTASSFTIRTSANISFYYFAIGN